MNPSEKTAIIFIDDEEHVLDSIRRSFRKLEKPWQPYFFSDPKEALEKITSLDECIIVTDWLMPGMDGITLSKEVKRAQDRAAGYYYVIVLTGRTGKDTDVEALLSGVDDILHKPFEKVGLMARIQAGMRILFYSKRLHQVNQRLETLSTTDQLTGLWNRRKGLNIVTSEIRRCKRGQQDMCLIMVDIDHFKSVNDTYGHDIGDEVIKQTAEHLRSVVREYDSVIRWGGEEFVIIAPLTHRTEGVAVAERIRAHLEQNPYRNQEQHLELAVTVSQGVISYQEAEQQLFSAPQQSSSANMHEKMIKFADLALYQAKEKGRNRVEIYAEQTQMELLSE